MAMDTLSLVATKISEKITEHPLLVAPFAFSGFFSIASYVAPVLIQNIFYDTFSVNLKKKYNAEWALVTGASSGESASFLTLP
jgi:hypothetical protein